MNSETKKTVLSILTLSSPVIVENLLQSLMGVIDTYFAGRIDDTAIAGISMTNQVMNIFIAFLRPLPLEALQL